MSEQSAESCAARAAWDEGFAARAEYDERRDVPTTWPDLNPYRAHSHRSERAITLTDFLLARIAEDETVARAAAPGPWRGWLGWFDEEEGKGDGFPDGPAVLGAVGEVVSEWHADKRDVAHIARHDPARVLAECDAKRRIVEELVDMEPVEDERRDQVVTIRWASQLLALPYADHPDYREEWKP